MQEQHVTATIWHTEVSYTMIVDGESVEAHDMLDGRIGAKRARLAIERREGRDVLIKDVAWHYDKGRMRGRDFLATAEIIESN